MEGFEDMIEFAFIWNYPYLLNLLVSVTYGLPYIYAALLSIIALSFPTSEGYFTYVLYIGYD